MNDLNDVINSIDQAIEAAEHVPQYILDGGLDEILTQDLEAIPLRRVYEIVTQRIELMAECYRTAGEAVVMRAAELRRQKEMN